MRRRITFNTTVSGIFIFSVRKWSFFFLAFQSLNPRARAAPSQGFLSFIVPVVDTIDAFPLRVSSKSVFRVRFRRVFVDRFAPTGLGRSRAPAFRSAPT